MKTITSATIVVLVTCTWSWGQSPRPVSAKDSLTSAIPHFRVVDVPNPEPFNDLLDAASASSPNDLWAVGDIALHYDGATWAPFPTALVDGVSRCSLTAVATISPTDAWGIGTFNNAGVLQGIIEHWDGTQWNLAPGPFTQGQSPLLFGMTAISASNIWAVGGYIDAPSNSIQPLFVHYNGTRWTQVFGPVVNSVQTILQSISAVSENDIYAVGYSGLQNNTSRTFVEHWDGNAWSIIASPSQGAGANQLNAVVALAHDNVWAAGFSVAVAPPQEAPRQTLIEHWDGSNWQIVASPNTGNGQFQSNQLYGITAFSSNNVWAYGSSFLPDGSNQQKTLVLRWDGARWAIVPSPSPKKSAFMSNVLFGGVAGTDGNLWIVGSQNEAPSPLLGALVLHRAGAQ